MNPYQAPPSTSESSPIPTPAGPPCRQCGSNKTSVDSFLRPKPSVLAVIFFGWYYLLIRGAFSIRKSVCQDCKATTRYKSTRSWIALILLILILILIGSVILEEYL